MRQNNLAASNHFWFSEGHLTEFAIGAANLSVNPGYRQLALRIQDHIEFFQIPQMQY